MHRALSQGELWTSIAIERRKAASAASSVPTSCAGDLSFLSGDFRRDYRYVLAAAEDAIGPVAFGCFSELSIFGELQSASARGAPGFGRSRCAT